jgi:hypothetical protein
MTVFKGYLPSRPAALRDALSPKLIRGEIRVKDAEKLVLLSISSIKKED